MNPRMTRDELLRRGAAGVTLLSLPGLLAACGGDDSGSDSEAGGELKKVLNFSNWEYYIDTKKPTTFEQFKNKTGIKVNYYEDVNSNDGFFAKVQGRLSQGKGIDRDLIVATDNSRFPGEYVKNEWVQKLDKNLIPNMSNLIDAQKSPPFDSNRDYSLPWLSGMDGIAWNENLTGPVTTVTQLFEDPKLKGKVGVWSEMGDSMGMVMLENGDDPSKVTDESFDAAIKKVQAAVDSGQIRKFYGNDYAQPLANGDLAACFAWSGDVAQLIVDNQKLHWGIAEKGGIIWTDNMLIPLGASVPTASTYMNFVYDPKIAAQIAVGTSYISSVKGVKDEAVKLDPKAAKNPLIFPPDDMLSQLHQNDPAMLSNPDYIQAWQAVQGQ
ncbi:MAG TPA: spermidine/putrescine ABC transporter substrate-binding protein [Gaiellaceae bacterium]